ncbi:hypothetical protein THIAE_08140 [Thiomicrospira aerophila AL3]|uniref:Haemin-degrading HemS/ChuX domain-containing protein n=1 Tax=Thiomicrospira aerophila AL3 TaxID=717772 RepID=W0DZS5_9GAMM|nr:ChuX/HutX family heme-like substrate-binding protein [Thiomicrospira aerophila]AHF02351.1 hypothetical protein THIAE_08140 [Thiomicrospira aerophila AL3]
MEIEFDRPSLLVAKQRCIDEKKRARNAAQLMGISELMYVLLGDLQKIHFIRKQDFKPLLQAFSGQFAMALTRNDAVVLEHTGELCYECYASGLVGWSQQDWLAEFDLSCWHYAIWLGADSRPSLQFYDASGEALHKLFVVDQTDRQGFMNAIAPFLMNPQDWAREVGVEGDPARSSREAGIERWLFMKLQACLKEHESVKSCRLIDKEALLLDWRLLSHRDNIGSLFKQYKITRPAGYALLSEGVFQLDTSALGQIFNHVRDKHLAVKITVANAGAIQTHRGLVNKLVTVGPWFNVLDPAFNMHLMETEVASIWLLTKGFDDDFAAHIECFDHQERLIISIAPCATERPADDQEWWNLINDLAYSARRVA